MQKKYIKLPLRDLREAFKAVIAAEVSKKTASRLWPILYSSIRDRASITVKKIK